MAEAALLFVPDLVLDTGGAQPHASLRRLDYDILDVTEIAPRDGVRGQLAHMDNCWRPQHRKRDRGRGWRPHPRRRCVLLLCGRHRLLTRGVDGAHHRAGTRMNGAEWLGRAHDTWGRAATMTATVRENNRCAER